MKTKNKMIAMVEIAIVLCSVFLVAIPAIAAEQNQEIQKTSAFEVTTASEDNYVLDIYGNANEDDTIDMRDLTYVKLIFFGKKPETELADAKYDGKINPLDFIQIKLIIVGKEKELTIVDSADRIVTVKKPIERVISINNYATEAIVVLKASDKIVGIDGYLKTSSYYFPEELLDKPIVGSWWEPDVEAIVALNPNVVITSAHAGAGQASELEKKLKPIGIAVVGLECFRCNILKSEIEKLGYILNKRCEANKYIDWRKSHEKIVEDFVAALSEEEKPRVFLEWGWGGIPISSGGKGSSNDASCAWAGGRNIAANLPEYPKVDTEWVLSENPDAIVKYVGLGEKWGWNNAGEPKKLISETINSRPGWSNLTATKNDHFYVISAEICWGPDSVVEFYMAKWFHPELDIDPEGIYEEYLERFLTVEYPTDLIFAYPPSAS